MTDTIGFDLNHVLYWVMAFAGILPTAVFLNNPTNLPAFVFMTMMGAITFFLVGGLQDRLF
jgi:hypothetical protein